MKRAIQLLIILLFAVSGMKAQLADGKIKIENLRVEEEREEVTVHFTATVDAKAVARNHTFVFTPVLSGGEYKVGLPPVIVMGKGSKTSRERREWAAGVSGGYENAILAANGQRIEYRAAIEAQEWMDGATLSLESVLGGCCSYNRQGESLLAEHIDLKRSAPEPEPEPAPEEWQPETVADYLSTAFTFVIPESEYDPDEPFKVYDDERESSLVVYYRVNRYDIERGYMENESTLQNLTTSVQMILNSTDSRVTRIIVAGFASPEGSLELNDRLAFERAVSVKEYLLRTTSATDERIVVYNGSIDWRGLRSMVQKSNLPDKKQIVDIIDHTPVLDNRGNAGRLAELMRLDGGRTYRYLLNEYFPYLRNGAFIKVYYENE